MTFTTNRAIKILVFALVVAAAGYFIFTLSYASENKIYEMVGTSMAPTYNDGDVIEASNIGAEEVKRGDIVVFESPFDKQQRNIKRVVGLPGDTVNLENGLIIVISPDGSSYIPYDDDNTAGEDSSVTVGADSFYIVGDNRKPGGSLDSRNDFGLLPFEKVIGVAK